MSEMWRELEKTLPPDDVNRLLKMATIYKIDLESPEWIPFALSQSTLIRLTRVIKDINQVTETAKENRRQMENMFSALICRIDEKFGEHMLVFDEKKDDFSKKVRVSGVLGAKHFWGEITKNVGEYQKISMSEINTHMNNSLARLIADATKKLQQERDYKFMLVLQTAVFTALIVMLILYVAKKYGFF